MIPTKSKLPLCPNTLKMIKSTSLSTWTNPKATIPAIGTNSIPIQGTKHTNRVETSIKLQINPLKGLFAFIQHQMTNFLKKITKKSKQNPNRYWKYHLSREPSPLMAAGPRQRHYWVPGGKVIITVPLAGTAVARMGWSLKPQIIRHEP